MFRASTPVDSFLRRCQDRRDRFLVVLEVSQILLSQLTIIGGDPVAVVGIIAAFHLIDQIPYCQSVFLSGAENQRLLVLMYLAHEQLDALLLPLLDFDDFVEVLLHIALPCFYLTFDQLIIRCVDILI